MTHKILVVDDEPQVVDVLKRTLEQHGYSVREASNGREAMESAQRTRPDLILLDIGLPDLVGTEVCRRLRAEEETRRIPIIMITALGSEADKVAAFEKGADDYITKPFNTREVVLRAQAILRRLAPEIEERRFKIGTLSVDVPDRRVLVEGNEVEMTAMELKLLAFFLAHPGHVHSREDLLDKVWGIDAEVMTRTVDTHVANLRRRLGPCGMWIETVRGVGYRFEPPA
ncbi:MAG: response regulator transcription factor [Nitrospirae bacterium]|nr:response regulator transcription factor [Nitrospirota bacterium]